MTPFKENDILILKKKHPCGSNEWQVLRTGIEYSLKCRGCNHVILISRDQLIKAVKKVM